jgi:serine/threonine-protein kinase RsbT
MGIPPSVREPAPDSGERAFEILTRFVSPPTARSILTLARQRKGIVGGRVEGAHLRDMLESIEHSLRMFVADPAQVQKCRALLEGLVGAREPTVEGATVPIRVEDDVVKARLEARRLATLLGYSTVGQTRLVTAVSELSRNIVQYAGEGRIDIRVEDSPRGIEIVAQDRGPGIPNLDQILAGHYKSRLGMGLGLRAVKKIADRFDIQTSAAGTTVRFAMKVG